MQPTMKEKARLGRVEALAALRLVRSEESQFDRLVRRSKRRCLHLTVAKLPMLRNYSDDRQNVFALAA